MSAPKARPQAKPHNPNYQHQNLTASHQLSSPDRTRTHASTNSNQKLSEKFDQIPNVSEKYQMERMPLNEFNHLKTLKEHQQFLKKSILKGLSYLMSFSTNAFLAIFLTENLA